MGATCCANPRGGAGANWGDGGGGDRALRPDAAVARAKLLDAWQQGLLVSPSGSRDALESGDDVPRAPGAGRPAEAGAALCCLVRAEWYESRLSYTGLFRRSDYGLAHLSLVRSPRGRGGGGRGLAARLLGPLVSSPARGAEADGPLLALLAVKFYRAGEASSSTLVFAGAPAEGAGAGPLARCLCTLVDEDALGLSEPPRAEGGGGQPRRAIGLSGFAGAGQSGQPCQGPAEFPWALLLEPVAPELLDPAATLARAAAIAPGAAVYEVFACPSPGAAFDPGFLEPLGRLCAVSRPRPAASCSLRQLRFRHQHGEEDYALRPQWRRELRPAHRACGAGHFEGLLRQRGRALAACSGGYAPRPMPCSPWTWEEPWAADAGGSAPAAAVGGPAPEGPPGLEPARSALASSLRRRGGVCGAGEGAAAAEGPPPPARQFRPGAEVWGRGSGAADAPAPPAQKFRAGPEIWSWDSSPAAAAALPSPAGAAEAAALEPQGQPSPGGHGGGGNGHWTAATAAALVALAMLRELATARAALAALAAAAGVLALLLLAPGLLGAAAPAATAPCEGEEDFQEPLPELRRGVSDHELVVVQ